jgi:hypothetical protein
VPNGLQILNDPTAEHRDARGRLTPNLADAALGTSPRVYGQVLTAGGSGAFDENFMAGLSVWWDENVHRWAGIYVGYNLGTLTLGGTAFGKIGLAWSDDLLNWTKDAANPILSPSGVIGTAPASGSITAPFMYWEPGGSYGTYYLFALGSDQKGYEQGNKTLLVWSATGTASGPPTSGWGSPTTVISTGAASWCASAIWHPNVVKVGDTYHMFVNGTAADTLERIGHASATSLLGPWTVDSAAVLDVGTAGAYDESHVADPWVYKVGRYWFMWHAGVDNSLNAKDGLAWTTDTAFPTGWRKHTRNPILADWADSTFNNTPGYNGARPSAIINTSHAHYHFYTVGWPERIGLAVQGAAADLETARGARRRPWQASDNGLLASNYDPATAAAGTVNTLGFVTLTKVYIPDTMTIANIVAAVSTAGATLTNNQCLAGIYKADGTLIANTASQHTNWQTANIYTMALTSVKSGQSLTRPGGTWVYVALLANGTTAPRFAVVADLNNASTVNFGLTGDATTGWRSAFKTSGAQTTLPLTLGATTRWTGPLWVGLT